MEKALHNYLKAKLHIETSDLSKDKIKKLLSERGVDAGTIKDFSSIMENCDLARYTPITAVTMQEDYDKAAKTISLIDKQAVKMKKYLYILSFLLSTWGFCPKSIII